MPSRREASRSEETIDEEAAAWFARMRAPDAAKDAEGLETWCAENSAHRAAYERIARQWDQTAFLANTGVGRSRDLANAFARDRPARRYAAVASIAAIGLTSLLALNLDRHSRQGHAPTAAPSLAQRGSTATIRTIALPDGSKVMLDADAVLRLAYTPDERRLRLEGGRARFTVAHDPGRRFIVEAGDGMIIAHGTVFEVAVQSRDVRVVLLKGRIEVRKTDRAQGNGPGVMLAPGQAVTLEAGRPISPKLGAADMPPRTGMLELDGSPLASAVAEINRHNRQEIRLADYVDARLRVSGAYRANDPAGFAEAIAAAFQLRVEHRPDGSIVIGKEGSPRPEGRK